MSILRRCPVCDSDAILQETGPDFRVGYYQRIFRCKQGHVFAEKFKFCRHEEPDIEIIKGEEK